MTFPLPLSQTFQVGRWRVHAIQAGGQLLDGGAMFGVVPKPLWERKIKPDERNRIQMGMRCLVVEHEVGPILIDTGAGNKETKKFYDIYGIENGLENAGEGGRTALEAGLEAVGLRPQDIALVIDSHLHFDHGGGNTYHDAKGKVQLSFPNARYVVQAGEYHYATHTNERTAASYFEHNFVPVQEAGRYDLVDGEREIVPGVRVIPTPGHTPHHQGVLLDGGNERAFFIGDLVPTVNHLPLAWIMGYDVEPLVTLETKRRILRQAEAEGWLVVFPHDAWTPFGWLRHDEKGYTLDSAPRSA